MRHPQRHPLAAVAPRSASRLAWLAGALVAIALALPARSALAQGTGSVSGVVASDLGTPLPGVQVTIPSLGVGNVSGADGRYLIARVPAGTYRLRAQRLGFQAREQEVSVADGRTTTANLTLTSAPTTLAEQVIVGYTTEQRRDITGAVASVSGTELQDQKVATIEEALRGRAAGVTVAASGEPGRPAQIIIRGQNGFGTPSPLYVVDGMYMTENPNLNPDDIESVEVLKDASAAAQYGAQASNGVVVIRTRHGQAGANELRLSTYYGYQAVPKRIDMMSTTQWQALNTQAYLNAGFAPASIPAGVTTATNVSTNWQDAVFRSGAIQDHNLQLSGGSADQSYFVSGGFLEQQGTIITTDFRRYSLRVNSDARRGRFSFGEALAVSRGDRQGLNGYPLIDVVRMTPTVPIYDPANPGGYGYGSPASPTYGTNPVGELQAQNNKFRSNQALGTVFGDVELLSRLHYRLNVGLNYNDSTVTNWRSIAQLRYLSANPYATLTNASATGTSVLVENLLNFDDSYRGGAHRVSAVAGTSSQRVDYDRLSAYRQGYTNETLQEINAGANAGASNTGFSIPFRTNALLARATYAFMDRYLLTASGRHDCSSRFSPDNRCGNFGAVSAGWVVSEEGFYKSIPFANRLDFLKLRASTGVLGDQNIGDFAYLAPIASNVNYIFNGTPVSGAIQTVLTNPDLKWQRNKSNDVGFDLGMMGQALTITADYYSNTSDQLLVSVPLAPDLGSGGNPIVNAGSVRNSGFELGARHHMERGRLQFNSALNLTTTRNRVVSLGNGGQPIFAGGINGQSISRTAVGSPIGEYYVRHMVGIFQNQAEVDAYKNSKGVVIQPGAKPGDVKYADINDDGTINDNDRYDAGNGVPKLQGGLFFDGRMGAFDFGLNFTGAYGNKIYNAVRYWTERMDDLNNSRAELSPWSPTNPSTTTPRAVFGAAGAENATVASDRWLESGSYTRLKNVILGYTIPDRLVRQFGTSIRQPRVYLNLQNLYTWTKYSGWDPEILGYGDPLARGIDDGYIYPNPRTVTIGLDLRL
ncbi:MAG: SusC/RagA family TonB-linked outer membrane protein [Gemmatimonadaceae bacterium]